MKEQIKALRNHLKLSQADFGAKLNSTRATVQAWEYGLNKPSAAMQTLICQCYGVNRTWLETGEGEMLVETTSRTLDRIRKRYGASDTFRAMLDVYASMTDAQQDAFEEYINMLARAVAAGQNPATVKPSVPTGSDIAETAAKEDDPEGELSGN